MLLIQEALQQGIKTYSSLNGSTQSNLKTAAAVMGVLESSGLVNTGYGSALNRVLLLQSGVIT